MVEKTLPDEKKKIIATPILTSIYVKNFGPIHEANIPLRNFTILMGPNNSGKSFLASLCIIAAKLIYKLAYRLIPLIMPVRIEYEKGTIIEHRDGKLLIKHKDMMEEKVIKEIESEYSINDVKKEIKLDVDELLCDVFTVKSSSELINWAAGKSEITFTFHIEDEEIPLKILIAKDGIHIEIDAFLEKILEKTEVLAYLLSFEVVYVPAERAGILRTYRQLFRLHLETSWPSILRKELKKKYEALVGKRIAPPALVKLFLDEILSIDTSRSQRLSESRIMNALNFLENAIGGSISIKEDLSITYTDKQSGLAIPLECSSSSVSEVAGMYLVTSLLSKDKLLIVEEPEAHLHPRGQMWVTRYFGQLVRNGVQVLVTTHSDLMALKAARLVGLNSINEEERIRLGYRKGEFLKEDELSICFLEITEKGSTAKEIKVSPTGEIENLPTYTTVLEEMYGEALQLFEIHRKISELP